MKITAVETLPVDRYLYVQVPTDAGITGLGESGAWAFPDASCCCRSVRASASSWHGMPASAIPTGRER